MFIPRKFYKYWILFLIIVIYIAVEIGKIGQKTDEVIKIVDSENMFKDQINLLKTKKKSRDESSDTISIMNTPNEVTNFSQFSKKKIYKCVQRSIDDWSTFVTCVKDPNTDEYISASIINGGVWESNIIKQEILAMKKFPKAIFLDLGCNIGVHSLAVAAINRTVVALDAIYGNLAFIIESRKQQIEKNQPVGSIRLLYNSISDHHETLYPVTIDERNEGMTHLLTKTQLDSQQYNKFKMSAPPVNSVTTLEILQWMGAEQIIMKIDVEGFECQALPASVLDQSSGTFIPYVFMEWNWINSNLLGRCPGANDLAMRFYKNGYIPKDANSMLDLSNDTSKWYDIVWVHQ